MNRNYDSHYKKFEIFSTETLKQNYNPINFVEKDLDKSFDKIHGGFTSMDPRLLSAGGSRIVLDQVPISGKVNREINHNPEYNSYEDIKLGSVTYYSGQESPYHGPMFPSKGYYTGYIHTDPMGSKTLEYDKTVLHSIHDSYSGLSYIDDTNFNRENIIASQSTRSDRERYYKPSREFLV
jgi:hypothetical protein